MFHFAGRASQLKHHMSAIILGDDHSKLSGTALKSTAAYRKPWGTVATLHSALRWPLPDCDSTWALPFMWYLVQGRKQGGPGISVSLWRSEAGGLKSERPASSSAGCEKRSKLLPKWGKQWPHAKMTRIKGINLMVKLIPSEYPKENHQ